MLAITYTSETLIVLIIVTVLMALNLVLYGDDGEDD